MKDKEIAKIKDGNYDIFNKKVMEEIHNQLFEKLNEHKFCAESIVVLFNMLAGLDPNIGL